MIIGILTFWETRDNYGQVLQGYALQKFLHSLGHEVFLIRYDHDGKFKRSMNTKSSKLAKFLKLFMVYPAISYVFHYKEKKEYRERIAYNQKMNIQRRFDQFRDKYFKYSTELYLTLDELQKNPPRADIYIVGSDQVWGWTLKRHDNRAFFLDFGPNTVKRIAYAPSFAMDVYPEKQKSVLAQLLKHFNAISVREKTGVAICKSVGYDAEWVCDPTMLLSKDEYLNISVKEKDMKSFVFVYSLNISEPEEIYWDQIQKLSRTINVNIKVTVSSGHIPANELFNDVCYDYATVEGWIGNISLADFVVTTSFHGVVFCILMNKKFAFVPLAGKYSNGNNRVVDLLEMMGMNKQIADKKNTIQEIYNYEPNWEHINMKVEDFRNKSKQYLNSYLN